MDVATQLLAQMSVPEADQVRLRMSWEDYLDLPEELFAEFVDGEVVVSPRPANVHGRVVARLSQALLNDFPELDVIAEGGIRLPRNRLRGPDVMVLAESADTTWVENVPLLVVEVLSRSTRSEDLLRKGPEYAAAGVGQFWVVDPEHRTLDAYENADGAWELQLHLDEAHAMGQVTIGAHGTVQLDVASLFPR